MECDKSCGNAGVHSSQSLGAEYVSMPAYVCVCLHLICVCVRPHVCLPFCVCLHLHMWVCTKSLSVGQAGMAETLHSSFSPNRATWVVGELIGAALAPQSPADSHQI